MENNIFENELESSNVLEQKNVKSTRFINSALFSNISHLTRNPNFTKCLLCEQPLMMVWFVLFVVVCFVCCGLFCLLWFVLFVVVCFVGSLQC